MNMKNLILTSGAAFLVAVSAVIVQESRSPSGYVVYNNPAPAMIKVNYIIPRMTFAARAGQRDVSRAVYQAAREHMEKNYARLTSLRQAALECHCSVEDLRCLFRLYGHEDAGQFLMRLKNSAAPAARLEKA